MIGAPCQGREAVPRTSGGGGGRVGAAPCLGEGAGQVEPSVPLPRFLLNPGSFRAASKQPQRGGAWSTEAEPRSTPCPGRSTHRAWEVPAVPGSCESSGIGPADPEAVWDGVTTVMIKNIPSRCHQDEVLEAIAQFGFGSRYTFFYLPTKTGKMLNYGYAFVSLPTEQDVTEFRRSLDGFQFARRKSSKAVALAPAKIQGFHDNMEHFLGSRVLDGEHPPIFRLAL
ncbi:unnamed protein product [Prorocentrum cordatum]|uniref:RRM domain-containing protein n=1 Tax=Prorocentrum cordatum TaxID=2364126 RepID=A0ABN9TQ20_9DINO|nr:unnamed protein product [Polarella glacialis]